MYSVVVLCAGKGTRSGLGYNKMFYQFQGQTIYEMTMKVFLEDNCCGQIIVVCRQDERGQFQQLCQDQRIEFVEGGQERQNSVYAGLQNVRYENVLIHDGARPYVKKEQIQLLLECLKTHQACLLMVPCKDTIKEVHHNQVVKTLKREMLMQAQTPQAFKKEIIIQAYKQGIEQGIQATDDAQMVEMFTNEKVYVVMGDYENKKITTKDDLIG